MYSKLVSASFIGLSCLASVASAAPFQFTNQAGQFPQINAPSKELNDTEIAALGTLPGPNGAAPTGLKPDTITTLQLIAFNEISEVAFFTQLYNNITNKVPGYTDFSGGNQALYDGVVKSVQAIIAQEKLHYLNAQGALKANAPDMVIAPCTYTFPVTNFKDAIALAATFTDVVLGTLGAAQKVLATNGDIALIPGIASVIGQEGEQVGGIRGLQGKAVSALPFLTAGNPVFAFSALNQLFVSNCPKSSYQTGSPAAAKAVQGINIPILGALSTDPAQISASTKSVKFTAKVDSQAANSYGSQAGSKLALTYINQQNVPVTVPISNPQISGNTITFSASFPFDDATKGAFFGNGLTIGALTRTGGAAFKDAADVAAAAVAGPALIEIN